ncbi:MAG: glycogen/starch/alpha-glucan phosphorylase [Defluviitaleaceae bacterium]|nr:glycogen/starch/alpha-glucan phosphorylase [Defluviitaleaceae bacterium]
MSLELGITKDELLNEVAENVKTMFRKSIKSANTVQIYQALAYAIKDVVTDKWIHTHEEYVEKDVKLVYYLSMEFLMGRFLGNMLINLKVSDVVSEVLEELGVDPAEIEDAERDPGLGNGGLGRLAACFLDSLSTLGYPAYGCGIRYHYGIFEQKIENGYQVEYPDAWLTEGDIWGVKRAEYACEIKFGGNAVPVLKENGDYRFVLENHQSVMAVPYDYPIVGYDSNLINTLRLWDAEPVNVFDLQSFNRGDYSKSVEEQRLAKKISDVLYPADEFEAGKELRIKQQYFFISATLQRVIERFMATHTDFSLIPEKIQFQLNDTHPSVAVAELMRLLVDEYDVPWNEAWEITRKACAYTNHTIMSEALEKWPIELFSRILPRIFMIVEEINRRFCALLISRFGDNPAKIRNMAIIADGQIRMAFLAIVGSHSVNGVAAIHSEILKNQELKDFYEIYPEKFNNKTNGITQRRWLAYCNTGLSRLITETIGDSWVKNLDALTGLVKYADDASFQEKFMQVKRDNKVKLVGHLETAYGIHVDPDSIFDIQVKRLHEYKRQLLNILNVMDMYNQIKANPGMDFQPRTYFFAAKAAAGYGRAKLIIKLINSVAQLVNNDKTVNGRIKVHFLPNYRVSMAQMLIPAADVSEQISTAGKEASGTGNMKFMLNGALTIGTMDGANIEIFEEVGKDNIFIFGLSAEQVYNLTVTGGYDPWDICNINQSVNRIMTQLINGTLDQNTALFRELYDALLNGYHGARPDEYYVLKDFDGYAKAQAEVGKLYKNKAAWARAAIINTAKSGKFSSDRTIKQYAEEIWKLPVVEI